MSSRSVRIKSYIVSAHPYVFDVFFIAGDRWTGLGRVTLRTIGGGVNQAQALVEADHQGYLALKAAGFAVRLLRKELCLASEDDVAFEKKKATSTGLG